jgi:uncharacterized protein YndB with AHSA1/START domain
MIRFTVEAEIARPTAEVFAYVTDPSKLPTWQRNTLSARTEDGGAVRRGARVREVHRGPGGAEFSSLAEVSEFDPGRVFALTMLEGPLLVDARVTFAPAGAGTLVRFVVHGRPDGAMRLAEPLLAVMLKQHFSEHCAALKRVLEDGGAAEEDRGRR